jgi:hypothetical protein
MSSALPAKALMGNLLLTPYQMYETLQSTSQVSLIRGGSCLLGFHMAILGSHRPVKRASRRSACVRLVCLCWPAPSWHVRLFGTYSSEAQLVVC